MSLTKDSINRQEKRIQMEKHQKVESRLPEQINKFKKDLSERINRLEKRLLWTGTIAVTVTGIVAAILAQFL